MSVGQFKFDSRILTWKAIIIAHKWGTAEENK